MIVDCHNHPDWHGHNLERFLANMAQHDIDVTWLLSWECPETEVPPGVTRVSSPLGSGNGPIPFALVVDYARRAPGKFLVGYAPDPRQPGAIDRLQAAIELYGVRVCGEFKLRMTCDNPDAIRMFRFCGEQGLPVVVHMEYPIESGDGWFQQTWWYGGAIGALERAIKSCPDTVFIGHGPGFWSHISDDDQCETVCYPTGKVKGTGTISSMLRDYANLYCDLSAYSGCNALSRDPEFAKDFVLEFQERLLFARDYFDSALRETLDGLELPGEVLRKIYSDNALRLVPITGQQT